MKYLTILIIVLSLNFFDCGVISKDSKSDDDLFPLAIIHINDFHARFEETNTASNPCKAEETCIGGYARTVTVVKQLKEKLKDKNPLYLNAGDNFQGSLWYSFKRWNVTSQFLNLLRADVMTIGNHEFDHGIAEVVPFMKTIQSPMVVANIDSSDEPSFQGHYNHSLVIDKNGTKIGIIGVVLKSFDELSNYKTEKLKFLDEVECVKIEAQKLNAQGVKIIIVLSHSGIEVDRKIAKEGGPFIDIIVGSHSHTFLYTGPPPGEDIPADEYPVIEEQPDGRKVYIVQASAFTKYVGELTTWFDRDGNIVRTEGNPIYLSNDIIPDPEIIEEVKPWKTEIDEIANKVHGETRVFLDSSSCYTSECPLGNLITDSFLVKDVVSIAVINAAGVRSSINIGNIKFSDLFEVLPYENDLIMFDLQGDKLLLALEHGVSRNGPSQSNLLQVSGLRVVIDMEKPIGERIIRVFTLNRENSTYEALDMSRYYRIVTQSYLANGGSGFSWFKDFGINRSVWTTDIEALTEHVEVVSPITQNSTENRIIFL
uniref:apyrase n=1 Tax=Culicoides sonorensis TaxID=179676 RepID=A0A336MEE1_CULSO